MSSELVAWVVGLCKRDAFAMRLLRECQWSYRDIYEYYTGEYDRHLPRHNEPDGVVR